MAIVFAHEATRRLKVAIVGCGNHSYRSIFPCFDYLAAEVVAVCDVDRSRAESYAKHFGVAAAFDSLGAAIRAGGLEAVVLAVGPAQHPMLACEALNAGVHVWMEKPPAADVAGIDKMIAARNQAGKVAAVGFKKAFMPVTQRMKQALAGGSYGTIQTIAARSPLGFPADGVAVLREGRFTNWLGNGVHPLSFLVHIGGRPAAVTARRAKAGGGFVLLDFPSGATACLHDSAGQGSTGAFERYEIVCERGHIICENNTQLTLYRPGAPFDYGRGWDFTAGGDETAAITYDVQHTLSTLYNKALFIQGFAPELDHYVSACLENRPVSIGTLEEARAVMECYEAALLSGGKPVLLDELPALRRQHGIGESK